MKDLTIRNSTAEFLIFQAQAKEDSIEVKYADETVWLSQKMIAKLFDKGRSTITEHLLSIYESGELDENSTCRKFRLVQKEGNREIKRVDSKKEHMGLTSWKNAPEGKIIKTDVSIAKNYLKKS